MVQWRKWLLPLTASLVITGSLYGGVQQEEHKVFKGIDKVKINVLSGDVIIRTGNTDEILVDLAWQVRPKGAFVPIYEKRGKLLRIKENWRGRNSTGRVTWTLTLPARTEVEFSSASGDISIVGLNRSFRGTTASGDYELSEMKGRMEISSASGDVDGDYLQGDIEIRTASGDIDLRDCRGTFDVSAASGDVDARNLVINDASGFTTASGDVKIQLATSANHDLVLVSASGDAYLDYNGNKIKGLIKMITHRSGRISSPLKSKGRERYKSRGRSYVEEVYRCGSDNPEIEIRTATGSAVLRK